MVANVANQAPKRPFRRRKESYSKIIGDNHVK